MEQPISGFAVASLVLGIFSVLFGWVPLFGWPFDILAITFGALGLRRIKKNNLSGKGLAIAGLTMGIIGISVSILALVGMVKFAVESDDVNGTEEFNQSAGAPEEKKELVNSGDFDIFDEPNSLLDGEEDEDKKKLVTNAEYDIFDEPNSLLDDEEEEKEPAVKDYSPYPNWGSWTGGITWRFPDECYREGDNFGESYWYAKYDPEGVRMYDYTMSGYGALVEGPGQMLEGVKYEWEYPVGAYTYEIEATRTGLKIKGTVYQERQQRCKDKHDPDSAAVYDELWGDLEGEIVS